MSAEASVEDSPVEVVNVGRILTIAEQQHLDRQHARNTDYYTVLLRDEVTDFIIKSVVPRYELDSERIPIRDENNKKIERCPHKVGLSCLASYGYSDHEIIGVFLGTRCRSTKNEIINEISMGHMLD